MTRGAVHGTYPAKSLKYKGKRLWIPGGAHPQRDCAKKNKPLGSLRTHDLFPRQGRTGTIRPLEIRESATDSANMPPSAGACYGFRVKIYSLDTLGASRYVSARNSGYCVPVLFPLRRSGEVLKRGQREKQGMRFNQRDKINQKRGPFPAIRHRIGDL